MKSSALLELASCLFKQELSFVQACMFRGMPRAEVSSIPMCLCAPALSVDCLLTFFALLRVLSVSVPDGLLDGILPAGLRISAFVSVKLLCALCGVRAHRTCFL